MNAYGMDGNQTAAEAMVQAGYLTQAMTASALTSILLAPVIPASCSQLINFAYGAIVAGGLNLVEQNALINARAQEGFDPLQFGIAVLGGGLSRGLMDADSCFSGDTQVRTRRGFVRSDELAVGDQVLSAPDDDPRARPEFRQVEEIFQTLAHVWHLHVNGQVVRTTPQHEFFAWGKGWVPARALQPGDLLRGHNGQFVAVEDVCDGGAEEAVYNCRVAEYHTYFVAGERCGSSVWAHNECAGKHHTWLRSLGNYLPYGNKALTLLNAADHTAVHQALKTFLRQQTRMVAGTVVDMLPRRGNPGIDVVRNFSQQERFLALEQFYRTQFPNLYQNFLAETMAAINGGVLR